ncbi:MAG: (2Fe-2S)-binding protein [Chromatiales bacterium]|nr:(2Fe-2S)-binding protein [Chromatiales bacterium]
MRSLTVNGAHYETAAPLHTPLIEVLRQLGLKGTKLGCASGECGACTVVLDGKAVCACLYPLGRVGSRNVETIEGVGTAEAPHPLQVALQESGAFQCGFCTPGTIMSLMALLRVNEQPVEAEIRRALQGNVCRCSGYKKLRDAVAHYVKDVR